MSAAGFRVVASAARVNDLVFDLELQGQPILLVVNAGDDLRAAISQIELFKVQHESGHVVLLADPGQHSGVQAVFRAGANGYLFMGPTTEQYIKALELVMLGETVLPRVLLPLILDREDEAIPVSANENFAPYFITPGEINSAAIWLKVKPTRSLQISSGSQKPPSKFMSNRCSRRSACSIARKRLCGR